MEGDLYKRRVYRPLTDQATTNVYNNNLLHEATHKNKCNLVSKGRSELYNMQIRIGDEKRKETDHGLIDNSFTNHNRLALKYPRKKISPKLSSTCDPNTNSSCSMSNTYMKQEWNRMLSQSSTQKAISGQVPSTEPVGYSINPRMKQHNFQQQQLWAWRSNLYSKQQSNASYNNRIKYGKELNNMVKCKFYEKQRKTQHNQSQIPTPLIEPPKFRTTIIYDLDDDWIREEILKEAQSSSNVTEPNDKPRIKQKPCPTSSSN